MRWPENEAWSLEFLKALSASQEGASTIPECFTAASGIAADDEESWYQQWKRVADENAKRAITAQRDKKQHTARNNWLRAAHYYRTAETQIRVGDSRRIGLLRRMQVCSRSFLECLQPNGETVRIPLGERACLDAYFLPASGPLGRSPAVICLGGPDHFKDDHLFRLPRHAQARGISLLLLELPNQRIERARRCRHEIEAAVAASVDYLIHRKDVDASRIGVFGDGLGAAFASRAAASDPRLRAAVCDAGIWDLHERAFATRWMSKTTIHGAVSAEVFAALRGGIANLIKCPIFVVLGAREALDVDLAVGLCKALRRSGSDISLRILRPSETGLGYGQIESPTIGNEIVFDWLSDRLKLQTQFDVKNELSEHAGPEEAYRRTGLVDPSSSLRCREGAIAQGE
ncbi:hypothetical protein ACVWXL_004682 [Bradyrhizobium sp. GM22.5]